MTEWRPYVDLVVHGTTVYAELGRLVHNSKRRPTHVSEYTWMSDIDNRACSHLADRRMYWMYHPITGAIATMFRSRVGADTIICETPPVVYGVAAMSMTDNQIIAVYDVLLGCAMIYEVMQMPIPQRTQINYLDHALTKLYAGLRTMPLERFGAMGLPENRITTCAGGGEFNLRRAIETCGLTSPFGKCMQLWAYELNYALYQRWSFRSVATDVIEPFLYTMLVPPDQPPPSHNNQRGWYR